MSFSPRTATSRRRARRILALTAILGATLAPAAQADTSSASVDRLSAGVGCDFGTHTASADASILLNQSRFPNGAQFAIRYFYWNVDSSLRRTSALGYTGWGLGRIGAQTVWHDSYFTGRFSTVQSFMTAETQLPARGAFRVGVQVAVWNGIAYEYTTTAADGYVVARYNSRVSPSSGTYCQA